MAAPLETTRVDNASSTVTYIGKARIGASEADPVWKIQKMITDANGGLSILHVDGQSKSNSTWNDRTLYAYA